MGKGGYNTPYDDVFRTLSVKCPELLIPLINELFQVHHPENEKIVLLQNEHFIQGRDGRTQERITDGSYLIGEEEAHYHIECQSWPDRSILIRVFEYDAQMALERSTLERETLRITFPHSAVLFLRHDAHTPETMKVSIKTPGGEVSYDVKVMKIKQYSLEEIKRKKLLFLIPFYIFCYEDEFERIETDRQKLEELLHQYRKICDWLEHLSRTHKIDEFIRCSILDMSKKVADAVTKKHENIRKGVEHIMGGKVLDYEASDILNRGIEQGIEQVICALIENCREFNCSLTDTEERVQKKFGVSRERAKELVEKYW